MRLALVVVGPSATLSHDRRRRSRCWRPRPPCCSWPSPDAAARPAASRGAAPREAVTARWPRAPAGQPQLPDALGEDGFGAWVEKYAGGDTTSATSMRDDAAFSKAIGAPSRTRWSSTTSSARGPRLTAGHGVRRPARPEHALYRQVRDRSTTAASRSAYGAAQRRRAACRCSSALAERRRRPARRLGPVPGGPVGEGPAEVRVHLRAGRPGTLLFADLATRKTPIAARVCVDTPRPYVPCSAAPGRGHRRDDPEHRDRAGRDHRPRGRPQGPNGQYVAPSDAEYAKLDRVCQT